MKLTSFQSASGHWFAGDYTDLANNSNHWMVLVRKLNIAPADFVDLLLNEYHATIESWSYSEKEEDRFFNLIYYFKESRDCEKFKRDMNKKLIGT